MTIPELGSGIWTTELVNHLWQSTVAVGIAWLLTFALRKNYARTRHWVWMVASVKFLLPFSLFVEAGKWLRSMVPASSTSVPQAAATIMDQVAQPFPQTQFSTAAAMPIAVQRENLLPVILLALWACGVLVVMVRIGYGWWQIQAAKRAATPLDLVADVPVLSSPMPIEPGIFGIICPVLLIPKGILQRLTADQLQSIVAHEMCHLRRRDNLTYAIHMVVETLFWFHPAVWWIGMRIIDERERACDEAVVQSGSTAQVYAEGILNVCKYYIESPLECASGVSGGDLKKRILRIMSAQKVLRLTWRTKLLLVVVALIVVSLPVALGLSKAEAQNAASTASMRDIVGTWQGTLHIAQANKDLRIVVQITKTNDSNYHATMNSIDQGGKPIIANKVSFEGGLLKYSFTSFGGLYEGKMSADGKSITGTWTQGSAPLALNLERATSDTAWPIPEPIKMMAADADPKFEVATIKPSQPDEIGKFFRFQERNYKTTNTNLKDIIVRAYGLHAKQIVNAPEWADTYLFDIDGIPDVSGTPNSKQIGVMLQKLLADRFQLKFHHETKELSVYAITVASGGPKMDKTTAAANDGQGFGFRGPGDLAARNTSMAEFASGMQAIVMDRPVVDQTGLKDKFDFKLQWTPDDSQFAQLKNALPATPPVAVKYANAASLYTAVQEQLGLKITATKASVDVIVIDHVEKPSPN